MLAAAGSDAHPVSAVTLAELQSRTLERLDEDGRNPRFWTLEECTAALNEAQRFMVMLTLCLEKTALLQLQPGAAWYKLGALLPDMLVPLRLVDYSTQQRLRPARLAELEARNAAWEVEPGEPERYAILGWDLLAVYPQPEEQRTLAILYAHAPARLILPEDQPQVPAEYHASLVDYAIVRLSLKLGAQQLAKALPWWGRFLADTRKLAGYVRARAVALGYDKTPIELERFDVSKLRREEWPTTLASPQEVAQ